MGLGLGKTFPFRNLTGNWEVLFVGGFWVDAVWSKADFFLLCKSTNVLCGQRYWTWEIREPESVLARHLYVLGGHAPKEIDMHQ
jgi:hypothetical protein